MLLNDEQRERKAQYLRRYREENRESLREKRRRYVENNRQKVAAAQSRYRAKNLAHLRERSRAYHARNRERLNEASRAYREANRERLERQQAQYRRRNRDLLNERQRRYRDANRARDAVLKRQYYAEHKEALREERAVRTRREIYELGVAPRQFHRKWTLSEISIAADRSLTNLQVAAIVKRTPAAVAAKRAQLRKTTETTTPGDDRMTHEIEILAPERPATMPALATLREQAQAMSDAAQLGAALAETDLVPQDYRGKPGNAAAAILLGAELGLSPVQSLQQIFVVHGRPAMYARTAAALAGRAGVRLDTIEATDQIVTIDAIRGDRTETSTWTIERATQAGYTKNQKYATNPQEMLWAKACMEVCRRIAPDVLLGIAYSREELELENQPAQRVTSRRGPARGVDGLRAAITPAAETAAAEHGKHEAAEPASAEPKPMNAATRTKWQNRLDGLLDQLGQDEIGMMQLAHAITGQQIAYVDGRLDCTDTQLRTLVTELAGWEKAGELRITAEAMIEQANARSAE